MECLFHWTVPVLGIAACLRSTPLPVLAHFTFSHSHPHAKYGAAFVSCVFVVGRCLYAMNKIVCCMTQDERHRR